MTIGADIVGVEAGPMLQEVDARWLMAYAAGIGWLEDGLGDRLSTTARIVAVERRKPGGTPVRSSSPTPARSPWTPRV